MGAIAGPIVGLISTIVGGLLGDSGSPPPAPEAPKAPVAETKKDTKDASQRKDSEAEKVRSARRRAATGSNITSFLGKEEITKKTLLGS